VLRRLERQLHSGGPAERDATDARRREHLRIHEDAGEGRVAHLEAALRAHVHQHELAFGARPRGGGRPVGRPVHLAPALAGELENRAAEPALGARGHGLEAGERRLELRAPFVEPVRRGHDLRGVAESSLHQDELACAIRRRRPAREEFEPRHAPPRERALDRDRVRILAARLQVPEQLRPVGVGIGRVVQLLRPDRQLRVRWPVGRTQNELERSLVGGLAA